ncbi:MAG: DMT family transporter [Alkaliphilus sp.]
MSANRNKGIFYMILASLFFALMASSVKYAGDLPTMEKVFFRNLVGLIISCCFIYKSKIRFLGVNKKFLLLRSIAGFTGAVFYFYTLDKLPLSNAVILQQTNPFFVLVFASFFLNERIKKSQILAILIAVTGVLFIVQPQHNYYLIPSLTGLLSAFFAAIAYTTVRYLRLSDHPQVIVFYFTGISTLLSLPFMLLGGFVMPSPSEFAALLLIGAFAFIAQTLMTKAYGYAEAGDLSLYSYGKTVFSVVIGIVFFLEMPSLVTIIGVSLVLFAAYFNYVSKGNYEFQKNLIQFVKRSINRS